jgi:transglutaminase-like putative cysteine protease
VENACYAEADATGADMAILTIRHITTYHYKQPVSFGEHRMMLRPRESHDQRLLEATLEISPKPTHLCWSTDLFDNQVAVARFAGRAATLSFDSTVRVDHRAASLDESGIEDFARTFPFNYRTQDQRDLAPYIARHCPDSGQQVDHWMLGFLRNCGTSDTRALLVSLTETIRKSFRHRVRHEQGVQEPHRTLEIGSGSCRDLAMFMMEAVRSLGMATRFVSGYLHVRDDDDVDISGGNTHAWIQVYLPGPGWVDFDPASVIIGNRDLVRVAVVRDPSQASPLYGSWIGFPSDFLEMTVAVSVKAAEPELNRRVALANR